MPSPAKKKKELEFWKIFMQLQMQQMLLPYRSGLRVFDDFGFVMYHYISHQRYSIPRNIYQKSSHFNQFESDLHTAYLNPNEFRQKYRMSRDSLFKLIDFVKDHKSFNGSSTTNKQTDPTHQLMSLLVYLGIERSGASNHGLRSLFRQGRGTFQLFKARCVDAIIDTIGDRYYSWPTEGERYAIAKWFLDQYG